MSNSVLWVFYDTLSKAQSQTLKTNDAQILILKMKPDQIERFFIWSQGWQNWQSLKTYLLSGQQHFHSCLSPVPDESTQKAAFRDVTQLTQTKTDPKGYNKKEDTKSYSGIELFENTMSRYIQSENISFNAEEINIWNVQKPNLDFSKVREKIKSREKRHDLKIEILIISNKGKLFRSRSKNISLSGSLLEDHIPFDYYDAPFEVVVINNSEKRVAGRISMKAKVVNPSSLSQRIQFVEVTEDKKNQLKKLLQSYIDNTQTKSAS